MENSVQGIIDKLSEGLNFFDFSYFISGFVTYSSIVYFIMTVFCKVINLPLWGLIVFSLVSIYISGLLSFSIGKWLRISCMFDNKGNPRRFFKKIGKESFDALFQSALQEFQITEKMPSSRKAYSMMWMVVRQKDMNGKFYPQLFRQWVMQAVYEGLIFSSILVFVFSVILCFNDSSNLWLYIMILLFSIITTIFCAREASRCAENQILEVVIAYKKFEE